MATQVGSIDFTAAGGFSSYASGQYATQTALAAANTAIEQNASAIALRATKTEVTEAIDGIEVGGRNLLYGTSATTEKAITASPTQSASYTEGWRWAVHRVDGATEYIASFDAKATVSGTMATCYFYSPNTTTSAKSSTGWTTTSSDGACNVTLTDEWARYWVKWTQSDTDSTNKALILGRLIKGNLTEETTITLRAPKITTGTKATDWSPAPEDMATSDDLTAETNARKAIYGICTTAATTAAKVVTCANFELYTGATIAVQFANGNSVAGLSLNVNGTGAKTVTVNAMSNYAAGTVTWPTYATCTFVYDGTYWRYTGSSSESTRITQAEARIELESDRIGMVVANEDASSSLQLTADAMEYIGDHVTITDSTGSSTVIQGGKLYTSMIAVGDLSDGSSYSTTSQMNTAINTAVDNIEVGGRNLALDTEWNNVATRWQAWGSPTTREIVESNGKRWLHLVTTATAFQGYQQDYTCRSGYTGELLTGDTITVSFTAYATTAASFAPVGFHFRDSSTIVQQWWPTVSVTTTPTRFTATTTVTGSNVVSFNVMVGSNTATAKELWISEVKVEKGTKATDWTPAPEDADDAINSAKQEAINGLGGFDILWNRAEFANDTNAGGECYLCAYDPTTATRTDANGWAMWNGTKRTITKGMFNPGTILPYNIPIYIVCRLSSATATTGTNYMVWYNSGWKYSAMSPSAVGGTWTWAEATDMVLGKFVEPGSEVAFTECETYRQPLKWGAITTDTVTARSALSTASGANYREQTIYRQAVSGTTSMTGTTTWVTSTAESASTDTSGITTIWTTKRPTYRSNYPVLFVATQRQTVAQSSGTTCTCTTPVKDDTVTVIDGGHITTGTIDASKVNVTNIKAENIASGTLAVGLMPSDVLNSEIEIGGRNFLLNTENPTSSKLPKPIGDGITWGGTAGGTLSFADGVMTFTSNSTSGEHYIRLNTPSHTQRVYEGMGADIHDSLILSGFVRASMSASDATVTVRAQPSTGTSWINTIILKNLRTSVETTSTSSVVILNSSSTEWVRFEVSIYIPESVAAVNAYYSFQQYGTFTVGDTIEFKQLKLERGTKATDWTPAPEDTDAAITEARSWYATCATAAATTAKEATTTDSGFELKEGVAVDVKFTNTNTGAVGSLTLNVNSTGAKSIKTMYNNSLANLTHAGQLYAGLVVRFVYSGTYWIAATNYNSDTYNRTRWQNVIRAIATANSVTNGHIICGTESGYRDIAAGVAFDLSYPLLYSGATISAASGTTDNTYLSINGISVTNNGTVQSAAQYKTVYLKGTLSGNSFTIASSNFLTCAVPTTADGCVYVPLGMFYNSTTNIYFSSSKELWAYVDGAFGPVSVREASAAAKTATNYITADATSGIKVHDAGDTSTYVQIVSSAISMVRSGVAYVRAFLNNAVATVRIGTDSDGHVDVTPDGMEVFADASTSVAEFGDETRIGDTSGNYALMDDDSFDIYHGGTQMAHFGYGEGTSSSGGTSTAPYYSLGTRKTTTSTYSSNSTYAVGDHVLYSGVEYVCISAITTGEAWTVGHWQKAVGNYSTAEGNWATAGGFASHAEGSGTVAAVYCSHAEGESTIAKGSTSHAEGGSTTAAGDWSHAEGAGTTASGATSHAEGSYTTASKEAAHAEGSYTTASGNFSHAQNLGTTAGYASQTAIGKYNDNQSTNAFEVGNGTSSTPSNAFAVDWDGNAAFGTDVDWTALPLDSAVHAYDNAYTPRYRRWGPMVQLIGDIQPTSAIAAGSSWNIGTLPEGCRPSQRISVLCQGSGQDIWMLRIDTYGQVMGDRYRNGGTTKALTTSMWLPFNVMFMVS